MSQLGRCCLWRTEYSISSQLRSTSCENMIWSWGQWLGCIIWQQELLLWIALTEAGTDAEQCHHCH